MKRLAEICIDRPVFASVIILILMVFGVFGYTKLGLDRYPKVDAPNVTVTTSYPGAAPEEIESDITEIIEEAVNTISGIDELRSVSYEGISQVTISFKLEKNSDTAAQEVRDQINAILNDLPEGVEQPTVTKMDPDSAPIISIALSGPPPLRNITEYADKTLKRKLEPISGIGQVSIVGGQARQINVKIDPIKLRAYNLTVTDVQNAIATHNNQTPRGSLETGPTNYSIRAKGRVTSITELMNIPLVNRNEFTVTVGKVATVEDSVEDSASIAKLNGKDAVLLNIRKQSGTNTVAIIKEVKERLEEIRPTLPEGYNFSYVSDQSTYIEASTFAVKEHLILGSILASIIVLIFLRNFKTTIIAAISIPASIIATFAMIWAMGYTLNEITLLALTLSVGIVIDDAIVVLENIYRYISEKGMSPMEAAKHGTGEISLAVMVITLSLIAVFMPIAFMSGMVGRFMGAFGVTMSFAIAISLLVSFTITPSMCAHWIKKRESKEDGHSSGDQLAHSGKIYGIVEAGYIKLLGWSMRHRWVIVLCCVGVLMSIPVLFAKVPKNFIPDDDQSGISISMKLPEGASLEATEALSDVIASDIRNIEGVRYVLVSIAGGTSEATNESSIQVDLVDIDKRSYSQQEIVEYVRTKIMPKYESMLSKSSVSGKSGMGGGDGPSGIQFAILGPDLDKVAEYSEAFLKQAKTVQGVVDVQSSLDLQKPEYGVTIKRDKAADLGVTVNEISSTLRTLIAGQKVSDFAEGGEQYEINLRADIPARSAVSGLGLVSVKSSKYGNVPLRDVVEYQEGKGPAQIRRLSRQKQVTISTNLLPGVSQQDVINKFTEISKTINMETGYSIQLAGMSKELGNATKSFLVAFLTAFIFMYLVIAAQFESWIHPFTILLCIPLTLPFALLSQILFGQSLNMFSALGLLVLFAVVKKNSILQIDHTIQLRESGMSRHDAIMLANKDRLRPILMTTIAFVAGMLPMIFAHGAGSATTKTIASLIIGGQTMSLLLTLIATPVIYSLMDDFSPIQFIRKTFFRKKLND